MPKTRHQRKYFKYSREPNDAIEVRIQNLMRQRLRALNEKYFDERNAHGYRHGNRWAIEISDEETTELRSLSAESIVYTKDVINHDTSIIQKQIEVVSNQLHSEMSKHLFELMKATTEGHGNVVNASDHGGDFPSSFLAMIEKIRFGVDRFGRPTTPTMYVAPSSGAKMLQLLNAQPSAYREKIDRLIVEKEKEATSEEAERISRFRWNAS